MKHLRVFGDVDEMNTALANSEIGVLGLAYDSGTPVLKVKPTPPPNNRTMRFGIRLQKEL